MSTNPIGSILRKALILEQEEAAELWLVRHAEPDREQVDPEAFSADPPLSQRGVLQALHLANRLGDCKVAAVYASPYRRTMETAQLIARPHGLTVTALADVSEIQLYAHRPPDTFLPALKEAMARYQPEIERAFLRTGRWTAFPFSEMSLEFRKRIMGAIEEVLQHHIAQRIVLVTHSPVINGYLAHLLDLRQDMWFQPEYTSVSIVRAWEDRRVVHSINDIAHLSNPCNIT